MPRIFAQQPWVLFIDADEWLTPEIKQEIEGVVRGNSEYDGFLVEAEKFLSGNHDMPLDGILITRSGSTRRIKGDGKAGFTPRLRLKER